MERRLLVVEPPSPDEPTKPPFPLGVGALAWWAPEACLTLVVKAAYSYASGKALEPLEDHPLPSRERASDEPDREGELARPDDWAPFKPAIDVLLVGHAYTTGAPTTRIDARVALGSVARSVVVVSQAPSDRIPLAPRHLRDIDGIGPTDPVGPIRPTSARPETLVHDEEFDYAAYAWASPLQRSAPLEAGARLVLEGLSPKGRVDLALPAATPRVLVAWAGHGDLEIAANLDTVLVDTDRQRVELTWRGVVDRPRDSRIDHVLVALDAPREDRTAAELRRGALRGAYRFAVEPDAPSPEPRPGTDEADRLAVARLEAHGAERAPEPALPLATYAAIAAELAEQREPRRDVLDRHDLDEGTWMVEERAWLETIADRATAGDGTIAARYGELFVEAQDRLAAPDEASRGAAEYAGIRVAMEDGEEPMKELEARSISLAAWMRLERRMARAMADDAALAEDVERRMARLRAMAGGAGG
jgi:hypothetical protein